MKELPARRTSEFLARKREREREKPYIVTAQRPCYFNVISLQPTPDEMCNLFTDELRFRRRAPISCNGAYVCACACKFGCEFALSLYVQHCCMFNLGCHTHTHTHYAITTLSSPCTLPARARWRQKHPFLPW